MQKWQSNTNPIKLSLRALQSRIIHAKNIRTWTQTFAKDPDELCKGKVKKLVDMGFPEAKAKEALAKNGFNEEAAINALLSM